MNDTSKKANDNSKRAADSTAQSRESSRRVTDFVSDLDAELAEIVASDSETVNHGHPLSKVEAAIGTIRTAYALGGEINRWIAQRKAESVDQGYGEDLNKQAFSKFARQHPSLVTSEERVRDLRRLAELTSPMDAAKELAKGFTQDEVDALCKQSRQRRYLLLLNPLFRVLRVRDRSRRQELISVMVEHGWTGADLDRSIKKG